MSRDEAIKKMKAVKAYMTAGNPMWGITEMGEAFDAAIEALEREPKKGKCLQNKARYFFCSECHYGVADVFEGNYKNEEQPYVFDDGKDWNFCPNCGAKMVNDDEA